jgi:anti-anti-sigma factor
MELRIEALSATITKAAPVGRWDVVGAASIDLQLSALSGSGRSVIIDLTEVAFLSSMGIRSILISAKAVSLRGGRLVLMSPDKNVETVLTTTGIDNLVPICHGMEAALAAIAAAPDA